MNEGITIKENLQILEQKLLDLSIEKDQLINAKSEIINDNLTAKGFTEFISSTTSADARGLKISDLDQSLLKELLLVEDELAQAKSKYKSNSSYVEGLKERLNTIQPLLKKNQIKAVDTALFINSAKMEDINKNIKIAKEYFLEQPDLIKEFDFLKQRLEISKENLSSLVKARENFQLRIAQSSVPWRVIEGPRIYPGPVSPGVKSNLAKGFLFSIIIALIIAFIRDRLDNVYHSKEEVESSLNLPLLGEISYVRSFKDVREKDINVLNVFINNDEKVISEEEKKLLRIDQFIYQESFRNIYLLYDFLMQIPN